ncbi:MAG: glycosyltransferase family 61 protein [Chitinophagales bacterium]|nr:glycosyltransferase family 61 protein [Chitinophagales bacterium]
MIISERVILKGYNSVRKLPMNYSNNDECYFRQDFQKNINDSIRYEYSNVLLNTHGVILNNFKLQKNLLLNQNWAKNYNFRYYLSCFIKNQIKILPSYETYLVVSDSWSAGYFHFLCDALPRLLALEDIVKNAVLLLPETHNSFHIELLAYFKPKKIVFYKSNQFLFCPKLVTVNYTAPTGNYNNSLINKLRDKLTSSAGYGNAEKKNIYISRKKAARRRILNETDVESLLLKYNFLVIYSEDYSMEEKINLFTGCNLLVSIHGAGLTNMLFMPKKSKVIEIRMPDDKSNLAYFTMASELEIDYYYTFSASLDNKHVGNDYYVNMIELESILNKINNIK